MKRQTNNNALIVAGGWDGHKPLETAARLARELKAVGIHTDIEGTLDVFSDVEKLKTYSLISPCWTMGELTKEQSTGLQTAIRGGCALAGLHGGAGDAFRGNIDYEWMVGGHFVGHPHVGDYTIRIKDLSSPICEGLPWYFPYRSEQYYMLVDPGVSVIADTEYFYEDRFVSMPVAWVKHWGKSRIFYSALGHDPAEFDEFPHALNLAIRGFRWAIGDL
jgi:type 1 glutamine amidotransferase